jgi:hypothetical protein
VNDYLRELARMPKDAPLAAVAFIVGAAVLAASLLTYC